MNQYNNKQSKSVNIKSMTSFPILKENNSKCNSAMFRFCGYQQHLSNVIYGQNISYQKKQKISLKNRQFKHNRTHTNDLEIQFLTQRTQDCINEGNIRALKHISPSTQRINKTQPPHHPSKVLISQISIKTAKKICEASPNINTGKVSTFIYYKAQEQAQHQQINYAQQFQKILFDQSQEMQSQMSNEPTIQMKIAKGNTFKSLQIFQSQSIQLDDNSPKSSIALPSSQSFKPTRSTIYQGKTSQSIFSPQDNQLQTKSAVSEVIYDDSFGELALANHFFNKKMKSNY